MERELLLEVRGVGRRYGAATALHDVSFSLARGSVLALLGVNGAGKSTTLRLLAGVMRPDSGSVRVAGEDLVARPAAARLLVGYLPERAPLYRELTVLECLGFCVALRGMRGAAASAAVARALERCALGEVRAKLVANLSKGFQQRVALAQAIAHSPPLLLLDEPTAGLDPVQVAGFHALIAELAREHSVVLSTHQLADVTRCAQHVVMLHEGRVRWAGPLAQLAADGDTIEARFLRVALAAEAA